MEDTIEFDYRAFDYELIENESPSPEPELKKIL